MTKNEKFSLKGLVPESWRCVDCGVNTAPGLLDREQMERTFAASAFNEWCEVYAVKPKVWGDARMTDMGGCLCIGCLENRLDRVLTPKDFKRNHAFNNLPGTNRLLARRDGR